MTVPTQLQNPRPRNSTLEIILMVGLLQAISAFTIDIMLPALSIMSQDFGVSETRAQLIVGVYFFGFAAGQLIHGPLSDQYGRKPILMGALGLYLLATIGILFTQDFTLLLALRALQGLLGAGMRIVPTALIRDQYAGAEMARIMSFAMMVFLIAPVIAPSIGTVFLQWGWHAIFIFIAALTGVLMLWAGLRLHETLPAEKRRVQNFTNLRNAASQVFHNKQSVAYTLILTFTFAILYTYLMSAPQMYKSFLGLSNTQFALAFGATGIMQTLGAFVNGALVTRLGLHKLIRYALWGICAISFLTVPHALLDHQVIGVWLHISLVLFFMSITFPNANSAALEPLGNIAGFASSIIGFVSSAGAGLLGSLIGQWAAGDFLKFGIGWTGLAFISLMILTWLWQRHRPEAKRVRV
ncbi:multidrug effflux MFS transporter [Deinococcus cellulosilyticus]|uniref:multidrug effflux MFS transporter n=1 Tax=Deinococcus cellulosilyticus TaxID=401558 RepID=UPI001649D1F4|nr:multidrug effflux MFS transporter [Deinococcus cellulosilyticus]